MALNPAQRLALGVDLPGEHEHLTEYGDTPRAVSTLGAATTPERVKNLKLVLKEGDKATSPKIRTLVNELVAENAENADFALKQLFAANPKLGLEMYLELTKFALPQLKAVAVAVDDRSDKPQAMSFQQLQALISQA